MLVDRLREIIHSGTRPVASDHVDLPGQVEFFDHRSMSATQAAKLITENDDKKREAYAYLITGVRSDGQGEILNVEVDYGFNPPYYKHYKRFTHNGKFESGYGSYSRIREDIENMKDVTVFGGRLRIDENAAPMPSGTAAEKINESFGAYYYKISGFSRGRPIAYEVKKEPQGEVILWEESPDGEFVQVPAVTVQDIKNRVASLKMAYVVNLQPNSK